MTRTTMIAASAALAILAGLPAAASAETLFMIVTTKDALMVGLSDAELQELGGDAGGIAKAIVAKGSLSLWQYGVTRHEGEMVVAPRAKIGVLAHDSLRIEPYKQSYKVMPHE